MKATNAGTIIGDALESYSQESESGKILTYINPGYWSPEDLSEKISKLIEKNEQIEERINSLEGRNRMLEEKIMSLQS